MTAILFTLTFLGPQAQPRLQAPPAPKVPVNKPLPRGHLPYRHQQARVDPRYYATNAVRFRHGYYYPGYRHPHWQHVQWDNRYGAWLYFDPGVRVWYYWCQPYHVYFPVSYLPEGCRYDTEYEAEPRKPNKIPPIPPPANDK